VGFALWTNSGLAWAQGTHEYKPMGVAVISATDLFRQRDFRPSRRAPENAATYVGLFASIVDLNDWLEKQRTRGSLRFSVRTLIE
jgi:hypothetical protein